MNTCNTFVLMSYNIFQSNNIKIASRPFHALNANQKHFTVNRINLQCDKARCGGMYNQEYLTTQQPTHCFK